MQRGCTGHATCILSHCCVILTRICFSFICNSLLYNKLLCNKRMILWECLYILHIHCFDSQYVNISGSCFNFVLSTNPETSATDIWYWRTAGIVNICSKIIITEQDFGVTLDHLWGQTTLYKHVLLRMLIWSAWQRYTSSWSTIERIDLLIPHRTPSSPRPTLSLVVILAHLLVWNIRSVEAPFQHATCALWKPVSLTLDRIFAVVTSVETRMFVASEETRISYARMSAHETSRFYWYMILTEIYPKFVLIV